jgi:non-ribosomal peptide synthetase component E (peptide arylation enzyme)
MYERLDQASDVYSMAQIGQFKADGLWLDKNVSDLLSERAAESPHAVAIVDEQRRATWAEMDDRVDRVAAGLIGLGLQPGDFIALQLPNVIEFVEAYVAAQRSGLRLLTMMTIYREKDVRFMLQKCGAKAIVVPDVHRRFDHSGLALRVKEDVPSLEHVIVVGEAVPGTVAYEELAAHGHVDSTEFARRRRDPDSMERVSFTSGTTGRPKGVVHTYNTSMVPPLLTAEAVGLDASTPIWMPSPISHATGLMFGVYDSLLTGAKLVLQDRWDPRRALELISQEGAAFTVSATPFIDEMLRVPNLDDFDLTRFRWFLSGGAPIPPRLVTLARDRMGTLLLRVFGQSEAPIHTLNFPDDPWEKITSRDGRPLRGMEVKIVDPDDHSITLPRGKVGEYATRGAHVFLGYFDEPDLTREAKDEDGWYFSGDLCTQDEEGYVLYVDRIKDIINRGGIKISALEVEEMVLSHPAVAAAAVVPEPDERLGERVCAFVILKEGQHLALKDLVEHFRSLGATTQKWPERVEIVQEFPSTPTGKIQKNLLRARLHDMEDMMAE